MMKNNLVTAENFLNRGNNYFNEKKYQEALNDFNKAIELDEDFALAYCCRAETYLKLGNFQKADENLQIAIRLDKDFYLARALRGYIKIRSNNIHEKEAIEDCTLAIKNQPTNSYFYQLRAEVYFYLGKYKESYLDLINNIQFKKVPRLKILNGYDFLSPI